MYTTLWVRVVVLLIPWVFLSGPEIWLEYAQYSIGGIGQEGGIEKVRSIFERALTAVGLHVTKGAAIWEAFREFENAILETVQVTTPGLALLLPGKL